MFFRRFMPSHSACRRREAELQRDLSASQALARAYAHDIHRWQTRADTYQYLYEFLEQGLIEKAVVGGEDDPKTAF